MREMNYLRMGSEEFEIADKKGRTMLGAYATPQLFGAKGDGLTDDTIAFQSVLDDGRTVVVPEGQYNLNEYLFSDDSIVTNRGIYTNKPLIVSKKIKDGAFLVADKKSIPFANLGIQWMQGVTYNSDKNTFIMAVWNMTEANCDRLLEFDADTFAVIKSVTQNIDNLYHGNDLTYNPKTKKIYCAKLDYNKVGEITVFDDDLVYVETITIDVNFAPKFISYDSVHDIYFIGNDECAYACDSNFGVIGQIGENCKSEFSSHGYKSISEVVGQGSFVVNGSLFYDVWLNGSTNERSYVRLVQYNYATKRIARMYDIPIDILAMEFEAAEVVGDKLYIFSEGTNQVMVTILEMNEVLASHDVDFLPTKLSITRNENAYFNATAVNRCSVWKYGKMGIANLHLLPSTPMPASSTAVIIGRIDNIALREFAGASGTPNRGGMAVQAQIKVNGDIEVYNNDLGGVPWTNIVRFAIPFMIK